MSHASALRSPIVAIAATLAAACGGGDDTNQVAASTSSASTRPIDAVPPSDPATLALFEATRANRDMSIAGFLHFDARGTPAVVWSQCVFNDGSLKVLLNGSPPTGASLPTGTHTYAVSFSDCLVDGLSGIYMNGTAIAVYTTSDWNEVTAQVNAISMRSSGMSLSGAFGDVIASGSGTWRSIGTVASTSYAYIPDAGSTLVHKLTNNVISFQTGSLSTESKSGATPSTRLSWDKMELTLNGVPYTLDGAIQIEQVAGGFVGSGEVQIKSGSVLAGRIRYINQQFHAEAFEPIVRF